MNPIGYNSLMKQIGIAPLKNTDNKMSNKTKNRTQQISEYSSIIVLNRQRQSAYKLLIYKLSRITHNKIKTNLTILKHYNKETMFMKIFTNKYKRNVKDGFLTILSQSKQNRQMKLELLLHNKKNFRILYGAIQGALVGNYHYIFWKIQKQSKRKKRIQTFCKTLGQKLQLYCLRIFKKQSIERIVLYAKCNISKNKIVKSLYRVLCNIQPYYKYKAFKNIFDEYQISKINDISENKSKSMKKVNEFNTDRNSVASSIKQQLKNYKNIIQVETATRNKLKMQNTRLFNKKKQELKQLSKKSVKIFYQLQKSQKQLHKIFDAMKPKHQKRLLQLRDAQHQQNHVLNIKDQIQSIPQTRYLQQYIDMIDKKSIDKLGSAQLLINTKYRQLILLYQSGKQRIQSKRWDIQKQALQQNKVLKQILKIIIKQHFNKGRQQWKLALEFIQN